MYTSSSKTGHTIPRGVHGTHSASIFGNHCLECTARRRGSHVLGASSHGDRHAAHHALLLGVLSLLDHRMEPVVEAVPPASLALDMKRAQGVHFTIDDMQLAQVVLAMVVGARHAAHVAARVVEKAGGETASSIA